MAKHQATSYISAGLGLEGDTDGLQLVGGILHVECLHYDSCLAIQGLDHTPQTIYQAPVVVGAQRRESSSVVVEKGVGPLVGVTLKARLRRVRTAGYKRENDEWDDRHPDEPRLAAVVSPQSSVHDVYSDRLNADPSCRIGASCVRSSAAMDRHGRPAHIGSQQLN